uniref:Uncharacterized protein n=1 Tax=Chromera velia CCMP2878 TaxID=1169474 RepID=A0A0G4HR37_9ALVE|eukprot:Cvel_30596.t1-p1 / transcript=Cvel_30596.t1 / gene=Cvel_30596 / organism=Chromera_velia_CCMP2878 / gene_product=hypothetical protein / transcript_product=hypothetical protein / location=Cvel_scaffold4385:6742-7892(-) / protein_length=293 / sequence_SO=supercontig / SO=protein_coding / is_pseudo=false
MARALRDSVSGGGADKILPSLVPFLSVFDLLRFRRCARSVWYEIGEGTFEGTGECFELKTRLPSCEPPLHMNPSAVVEFTEGGRQFSMALANVFDTWWEGGGAPDDVPERVFRHFLGVRVWDRTPGASERMDAARAEDTEFVRLKSVIGEQYEAGRGKAVSAVRWQIDLWNWNISSWEKRDITQWRHTSDHEPPYRPHITERWKTSLGVWCDTAEFEGYSQSRDRFGNDGDRQKLSFVRLDLSDPVLKGVLGGPTGTVVARVKVLKFLDWSPALETERETGRGRLDAAPLGLD